MKTNVKTDKRFSDVKLAGGFGLNAANQSAEGELRRCVLSCLLWEDIAYAKGYEVAQNIKQLISQVSPEVVSEIAVAARYEQKLRHVPLYICAVMAGLPEHKKLVSSTLFSVINRPDEITEFVSIYWKDGKKPLSAQVKKGLALAFSKFDEYAFAKWNRKNDIKLKDVMKLVHPVPPQGKGELYTKLFNDELDTPDTWEVQISKAGSDLVLKRAAWERLLLDNKLGSLALLKNLRGMLECKVDENLILNALNKAKTAFLLPIDFVRAADNAPTLIKPIEDLMFRCLSSYKKLPGKTIFVLDVSGSMGAKLSNKTDYTRIDAGMSMALLANELCERCSIYLTAGSDSLRIHKTELVPSYRGFGLRAHIRNNINRMGGGGIFTRQCLDYIKEKEGADRIIVFSDSQDCDHVKKAPSPFGKTNYIIDVSSHKNGINYKGVWTAEISGWSEHFLRYIAEVESL